MHIIANHCHPHSTNFRYNLYNLTMDDQVLSVRELQKDDIQSIIDYWSKHDAAYYESMGVDVNKLPQEDQLSEMLLDQIATSVENKKAYCVIWECNGQAIGHCNLNPVSFGEEAHMHLHMWDGGTRNRGMGTTLLKLTLPFFFKKLKLKTLYCQPYAINDAPNKTLLRVGFEFEKEYVTIPGSLNFEQPVKRWLLTRERFNELVKEL